MLTTTRTADGGRHRDRGFTLIEVVISIVLLGLVVAGSLAALRGTVLAGTLHRDHSNAHAWLQSASDVLYAAPKVYCNPAAPDKGEAAVRRAYDLVVDSVENPEGWTNRQIRVVPKVQFWNAGNIDADADIEYFFGSKCDPSLTLQLVVIEVRAPSGRIIETVELVK